MMIANSRPAVRASTSIVIARPSPRIRSSRWTGGRCFVTTLKFFERFLDRLLADAGWSRDAVELIVPHQASPAALAHLAERCGFGRERVVDIMRDHGNQIAASLPTALDHARRAGRLKPGTRALLLGTSAGLSLGGIALVA